jgi:hypothetical protein
VSNGKRTKKQRQGERMEREGKPLRFHARAHLHPETFAPLIRFRAGDRLDISVPVEMMRGLAALISDAAIMAELMAGHAIMLQTTPELTMEEYSDNAPGEPYTEIELRRAVQRATDDYQNMLIEAWNLGTLARKTKGDTIPPEELQRIRDVLAKEGIDTTTPEELDEEEGKPDDDA